jgi:AcrR family transcriptional regulator
MGSHFTPINPLAGAETERSDAARNRAKVLCAAGKLFAERGIENVTMDEVAEAAGVGKGTLYRRFGDRSGLAIAVLDAHDRTLQELLIRGDPPLGPGAPPRERLMAFTDAMIDHVERVGPLLEAAGSARYRSSVYVGYHLHVAMLLRQARPDSDASILADLVLAPLAPDLFRHLTDGRGITKAQVAAAVRDAVCGIIGPTTG